MVSRSVFVVWLALGILTLPSMPAHARGKRAVVFVPNATGKMVQTTVPARSVKVVRPQPKPAWPFVGANLPKSLPHGIGEVGDLPVWVRVRSRGQGRQVISRPKPKPVWPFVGADRPLSLPDGTGEAGKLPQWVKNGVTNGQSPIITVIKGNKGNRPKPKPVLPFEGANRPISLPHGLGPSGDLPVWVSTVR